jgi:hypothetical protein
VVALEHGQDCVGHVLAGLGSLEEWDEGAIELIGVGAGNVPQLPANVSGRLDDPDVVIRHRPACS